MVTQSEMAAFACSDHTYEFVNLIYKDNMKKVHFGHIDYQDFKIIKNFIHQIK